MARSSRGGVTWPETMRWGLRKKYWSCGPRAAPTPAKTEISEGKVKGDDISFCVVRELNGNKMTTKYSGKVEFTDEETKQKD